MFPCTDRREEKRMREIKFRAWVARTTDHYITDPIDIAHKEFKELEPNCNTDEWDIWYSDREIRVGEIRDTMDIKAEDRYEIALEMIPCGITDKGLAIRPHNCKFIDIMQYTGLKDKNSVEICEGDIADCPEHECCGYISWNESEAGFYFNVLLEDGNYEEENLYDYVDSLKVIGNIYENPDLLGTANGKL